MQHMHTHKAVTECIEAKKVTLSSKAINLTLTAYEEGREEWGNEEVAAGNNKVKTPSKNIVYSISQRGY